MNKLTQFVALMSVLMILALEVNASGNHETQVINSLRALLAEEKILVDPVHVGNNQRFGNAVSISGNRAVVGASKDNINGPSSGSVYIFEFIDNQWLQTQKITGDDTLGNDEFGAAVSIYQDRLLVGARNKTVNGVSFAGAAYLFEYINDSWVQIERFSDTSPSGTAQLGYAVSLYDNQALVGAPSTGAGEVLVFTFDEKDNSWFQSNTLSANSQGFGDQFGHSVSLYQGRALIGANRFESSNIGAAFYFGSVSNNTDQHQITPSDGMSSDNFGFSVSLYEDRALIGAPEDSGVNGDDSGSAYIFEYDSLNELWVEIEKLTADDGAANDEFGHSVSLNGDRVLVGAWGDDDNGTNSGSAYIFDFDGSFWSQSSKLIPSNGASSEEYARAVFLTNDWAIVGVPNDSEAGVLEGAVYVYQEDVIFNNGFN